MANLEHSTDSAENAYQLSYVNRSPVHRSHLNLLGFDNFQVVVEYYDDSAQVALASRSIRIDHNSGRGPYGLSPFYCRLSI